MERTRRPLFQWISMFFPLEFPFNFLKSISLPLKSQLSFKVGITSWLERYLNFNSFGMAETIEHHFMYIFFSTPLLIHMLKSISLPSLSYKSEMYLYHKPAIKFNFLLCQYANSWLIQCSGANPKRIIEGGGGGGGHTWDFFFGPPPASRVAQVPRKRSWAEGGGGGGTPTLFSDSTFLAQMVHNVREHVKRVFISINNHPTQNSGGGGGTFDIMSPTFKIVGWGTCPSAPPPRICAHASMYMYSRNRWSSKCESWRRHSRVDWRSRGPVWATVTRIHRTTALWDVWLHYR